MFAIKISLTRYCSIIYKAFHVFKRIHVIFLYQSITDATSKRNLFPKD